MCCKVYVHVLNLKAFNQKRGVGGWWPGFSSSLYCLLKHVATFNSDFYIYILFRDNDCDMVLNTN